VIEAYALVLGALMLLCGALADRYGRKRLFIVGTAVFAIGSLACAFAGSIEALVAARVLQAAGGTMLAPASLAMLSACFSARASKARPEERRSGPGRPLRRLRP